MKIVRIVSATDLMNETWSCNDFWEVIQYQGLEDELNEWFDDYCSNGIELTMTQFNDMIRFDGDTILKEIGADLKGTVFEDEDED